eukprot:comp21878_c1_seq1/m.31307 comp21878_c1_seq1/g.31307  ORF comp21878_c1_seq1/g.31307 comp21878_c1_seq1/m.31307 type:complete len:371 (-) comp21878_c1_seq1:413-1525(-)
MTGGPGCSSEIALFYENGACIINEDRKTTRPNPFSWNSKASIIYIDQPAGVGFSTGVANATNENDVANQMYDFLTRFFTANPTIQNNGFWVFGESYGGHYVPAVAAKILRENLKNPALQINLQGIGVGNGLTEPLVQYGYYGEYSMHTPVKPLISKFTYNMMQAAWPQCKRLIQACQDGDDASCEKGQGYCNMALMSPVLSKGYNQYDVRVKCEHPPLCYDMSDVDDFLKQPEIRKALGVDPSVTWQACNMEVNRHFAKDWLHNFDFDIVELLAHGKHVLIYAGEDDYVCNYMGNKAWCEQMAWPHKEEWNKAPDTPWIYKGKQAGIVKTHANFTFLQVHEAGHMVPMDQPEVSLAMLDIFLYGDKFTPK